MVLTDDEEAAIKAAVLGTSGINGDIDVHWILYCGTLVFLMQTGFAMLCAGSIRAKNAQNILLKNLLDACVGAIWFWATGYAFAYGQSGSDKNWFIGNNYFFLSKGYETAPATTTGSSSSPSRRRLLPLSQVPSRSGAPWRPMRGTAPS